MRLRTVTLHTVALAAMMGIFFALPIHAQQVSDPLGDFESTYTGVQAGDLDVLTTNVQFTPTSLIFTGTMNGTIGTTANSLYVFGLNRGAGTARFANIGKNGVLFDSVVTMTGLGVVATRDLISNVGTTQANASINGRSFTFTAPLSALTSQGFAVNQYTYNLWPRLSAGGGAQPVADFAPDNSNAFVTAVPEPSSLAALALGGLALIGIIIRRRRIA